MSIVRRIALLAGTAGLLAALASTLAAQAPNEAPAAGPPGPVAARTMPRGTVLRAADVAGDASGVLGLETQRVVTAGEALRAPAIAPAAVVHSGDSVTVRVEHDGIVVSRLGVALGTARSGQPVRVRLGQHSLSGVAAAPGVVRLP